MVPRGRIELPTSSLPMKKQLEADRKAAALRANLKRRKTAARKGDGAQGKTPTIQGGNPEESATDLRR